MTTKQFRSTRPQGAPPSDVGVRRLPADGRHVPAARRPAARRRLPDHSRPPRPRRRRRHRQRVHPGRTARRAGHRLRPHARRCSRPGARRPEAEGLDIDWVPADAEDLPFDDGSFDVVMSCIGVMFAPYHQTGGRRARPGLPARRHDRAAQLDAGGDDRRAVPHPEGVRPAPAAGRPVAAAVGQRGAPGRPVRRPGRVRTLWSASRWRSPPSARPGLGRALQDLLRPDHRRSGERRPQRPRGRVRRGTGRTSAPSGTGAPRSRPTSSRSTCSPWGRGFSVGHEATDRRASPADARRTPPPQCGCVRRAWSGSG